MLTLRVVYLSFEIVATKPTLCTVYVPTPSPFVSVVMTTACQHTSFTIDGQHWC